MKEFLIFRLYGPMAAWGEIAVGEYRPSSMHPSKSAVLGLVASALGISRGDKETLDAITEAYGFATFVEASGTHLRDYHTIQVPGARRGAIYATRKDELDARGKDGTRDLNTILSTRDYRCDALYTGCLWSLSPDAPFSVEVIRNALEKPRYALYLGRRSCPLALPLEAQVMEADTFDQAVAKVKFKSEEFLKRLKMNDMISVHWDRGAESRLQSTQAVPRRDISRDRRMWRFSERIEHQTGIDRKRES